MDAISVSAIVGVIIVLSFLIGLVWNRLVRSERIVVPRANSRRDIASYCKRLRLQDVADSPGVKADDLARELVRLLTLLALHPDRIVPVEGVVRVGWERLVLQREQYQRICRNLFGAYSTVRHDRLESALVGNIGSIWSEFANDYKAEFGEEPPATIWVKPGAGENCGPGSEILLLFAAPELVREVIRKDGEHLKTDYYGGMGQR